jgi:predicted transposase YdaD
MYMDAMKLMNQKYYIMKHYRITEMEIEEIKREMQARQKGQQAGREEGKVSTCG